MFTFFRALLSYDQQSPSETILYLIDQIRDTSYCIDWNNVKRFWKELIQNGDLNRNIDGYSSRQNEIFNHSPLLLNCQIFLSRSFPENSDLGKIFNYNQSIPSIPPITSNLELQNILRDSLLSIQNQFYDENPSVVDIWNIKNGPNKIIEPKSEDHISDYLVRVFRKILNGNGIILNREISIHNSKGFVDIKCEKYYPSDRELRCYIEVKGCWNKEIKTNLKSQLYDKYLKKNRCNAGIFLVIWTICDSWSDNDKRKKRAMSYFSTMEELKEFLANQVSDLDDPNVPIIPFVLDGRLIHYE